MQHLRQRKKYVFPLSYLLVSDIISKDMIQSKPNLYLTPKPPKRDNKWRYYQVNTKRVRLFYVHFKDRRGRN